MKKRTRRIMALLVAVALCCGFFVARTIYDAGEFRTLRPHGPTDCRLVPGLAGSEDIAVEPNLGVAFISSAEMRRPPGEKSSPTEGIFLYDLNLEDAPLVSLTEGLPFPFHPHGIGLYTGDDGAITLMAVNHRPGGSSVEVFGYESGMLAHRATITDPAMTSPNDVIPVGNGCFYVSNDHGSRTDWGRALEEYLRLPRAGVLYYDGRGFRAAAGGMRYANGVNISPDGKIVYVAETTGRCIDVFGRDPATGDLTPARRVMLDTGPDNIDVDTDGTLYIGCHPKLLTFVAYSRDARRTSPSQVLAVYPDDHDRVEEIYLSTGRPLSGSSVGAVYDGRLLVGSVFDDAFSICQLP